MCSIRVAIILIVLMCVNLSTSVASNMPDGKNIDSPSLTTIKDKIDEIEDYINSKPELEKRAQACIATYEKIAQAKNYISSIAELFKNKINVPPFGANSLLNYEATYIQSEKAFKIKADLGGNRDFPLFCGNLSFDKTSSIEVELRDGSVYPTILANGTLSVVAPIGKDTANTKLVLPDLRFENLRISRDAPVFDIVDFMKTEAIPGIQRGKYPVKAMYVLPGKNKTTSEIIIETEFK